jgi:hypothetical protein
MIIGFIAMKIFLSQMNTYTTQAAGRENEATSAYRF